VSLTRDERGRSIGGGVATGIHNGSSSAQLMLEDGRRSDDRNVRSKLATGGQGERPEGHQHCARPALSKGESGTEKLNRQAGGRFEVKAVAAYAWTCRVRPSC